MKAEKLYELLGGINEEYIREASVHRYNHDRKSKEKIKNIYSTKLFEKKNVLIAAVLALLLCGTVAAGGLLWRKPNVITNEDGHTLVVEHGYVELPDDAVRKIMENRIPERNNKCFLNFETVAEWQDFFELPLAASSLMVFDETNGQVDYGDGVLLPYGSIDTIVTSDGDRLCLMDTQMNVARHDEQSKKLIWDGILSIYAVLSEESVSEAKSTIKAENVVSAETLTESATSAGIPYVIRRITSGDKGETVQLFLYYGYESVMYELWVTVHSPEEETRIAEDLKVIAETLEIIYK